MSFIKNKEDFVCENCGAEVLGDGYTNHCPSCLWSKHVDINPGDRLSVCRGLMKPVSLDKIGKEEKIIHRCVLCSYEKKNKLSKDDNYDKVIAISPRS